MGINNVNTANKASIIKLALNKKSVRNAQTYKPEYMKMTGSIFNAKTPESNPERANLTELNTKQSIGELKAPTTGGKKKVEENKFENVDDVSSGKAAISEGRASAESVRKQTVKTEKDAKLAKNISQDANKLGKNIQDNDKKFVSKLRKDQKEFEKDNTRIQKLVKESEENQKEVEDAQHELDTLLASNSFDMGNAHGSSNSKNNGRIAELQTLIGSKVGLMQKNGKAIYSLQRSQSRTLSGMNKTNKLYINNQKVNQKNLKSQQTQTNSVVEVAQQIEQYSAIAQAGGQALGLAGDALIALGQSLVGSLFGSAAGSAMITVGGVMKKVGSVLELVGQYGQTAANLTKTAAYAAEGNIMGAMMSCAAAVQSGTAAVKSTGNIGKEFKNIDAQANAAKQNIEAKEAAKNAVDNAINNVDKNALAQKLGKNVDDLTKKDLANEALGGMTRKQAIKSTRNTLRNQMAEANNLSNKMKDLSDYARDNAEGNLKDSIGKFKDFKADPKNKLKKFKAPKLVDGAKSKFDIGKTFQGLGSSAMTIGSVFMQNKAMNDMSSAAKKKHLEPFQMDARTKRIMARNQRYRQHAAFV